MSAMNCFVGEREIHLFTDGALYDEGNGFEVKGFTSKVLYLPHLHAAVASTGAGWVTTMLGVELASACVTCFDDLVSQFSDVFRSMVTKAKTVPALPAIGITNVVLLGISTEDGPAAYSMWSTDMEGVEAYVLCRIHDYRSPTNVLLDEMPFQSSKAAQDGLALMQWQRREVGQLRDGSGACGYGVGGFCQHTIIDDQGIHARIIHRWPDQIGKPINPPQSVKGRLFV